VEWKGGNHDVATGPGTVLPLRSSLTPFLLINCALAVSVTVWSYGINIVQPIFVLFRQFSTIELKEAALSKLIFADSIRSLC
jgi:hypothetical protein